MMNKHGEILEGLKSINEDKFASILKKISNAEKGATAKGGGYGPFKKLGDNSWKDTSSGRLLNDENLASRIGKFDDFIIEGVVTEGDVSAMVGPDVANFLGDELTDVLGSVIKEIGTTLKLKFKDSDINQLIDKFKHTKSSYIDSMADVITDFMEKEVAEYKKNGKVDV